LASGAYTVQMEKVDFFVLRGQTVQLSADSSEFSFTLNHIQEVREKVDVVADPNRIEPTETTQTATLTSTEFFYIPVPSAHDYQQSLIALPQIVRDNQALLHIAGARSTQAQYLMDGFEVGDPVSGALTFPIIVDALRTAEVETGRFGAEYAHPGAAILKFETPDGDDHWRFNATDFIPGISVQQGVRFGNYYPRITFSGPLVKGQLWLLQSFSFDHTLNIVRDISSGANVSVVVLNQSSVRGEIQAFNVPQQNAPPQLVRLTTFTGNANIDVSNTLAGAFVQDNWSLGAHFVAQLGFRVDWDQFVRTALAEPRASVNYLPFADGRGKFSLGWGIYNIPLNLSVLGQTQDQQQVDTLYFYGSQCNPPQPVCTTGPATSTFTQPPGGLQQPYFDITSAGWQERIWKKTILSVELLARNGHHELAYETSNPGQIGGTFLLQSSLRDKYRGATMAVRHTFENGATLFGSYTRSRANTDQVLDPVLGALYFAPQQGAPLAWDAPNRALSWGTVPTPFWGIDFAYLFEYRTGYPFSVVNQQQFLVGAPNSKRFPSYASLNISLEKKFRFRKYLFAVRGSVINLTDRQNPNVVVNNIDAMGVTPGYLIFSGGQGRAFTGRLRFLGKR